MTATLMPNGKLRFFDILGDPLVGGKLYTYAAGTNVPKQTFVDQAGLIANTNPVILDVRGEALVRWDGTYKYVLRDANDVLIDTVDDFTVPLSLLATTAGAGDVGFSDLITYPAGSIGNYLNIVEIKLQERISVKDAAFGAVGDGVTDDTAAIQAAIDSFGASVGELWFPRGVYLISSPLTVTGSGMQIVGESPSNTYLTTASGAFDLLRIAGSYCRVTGLQFRPGGDQVCLRIYAAHCTVDNNRFLADVNNVGTAVLLTDIDPVSMAFVAGAYTHTFYNNLIGVSGFAFAQGIDDASTMGIQACKFMCNQMLSDSPFRITRGGGNTYFGNLLQTSTGTIGVPAGNGIDLGASVTGEMIYGNYFEKFAKGAITRQMSNVYQSAHFTGNQIDNCTAPFESIGNYNYVYENPIGNTRFQNGWTMDFNSAAYMGFKTLTGVYAFGYDSAANFCAGITNSSSHHIKKIGAEGTILLQIDGGARGSYWQTVDGAGGNGANSALNIGGNGATGRSINAGGTINASGADYAEYMYKSFGCGPIAKGQIVGVNANGKLTDKWAHAHSFVIKSTDPSYVGNDVWAKSLGDRPTDPDAIEDYERELEVLRQFVDRVAFAGQVPVNVTGAAPGQYIIPVQDGAGIKGIAVSSPTMEQYLLAVGKVVAIEADGRARVLVKVA